jgi:amylosucrase
MKKSIGCNYMNQVISRLETIYYELYGHSKENKLAFKKLLSLLNDAKTNRRLSLKKIKDDWYTDPSIVGMTLYVDLFARNLIDIKSKIDYFKTLGINFIHFMPLLETRQGDNDGGYAVKNYQNIDPSIGTNETFIDLLDFLRANEIYVCIDYVINHVAIEHEWAQKALHGDKEAQDMFYMYDDERIPNHFDQTVPEVLPNREPGNFTYYKEIKKFVWTSFASFQWDLNFQNPKVFHGMTENMLFLANLGVNMIRLDAIPFMWKTLETSCRNLPEIHVLLHMLNLVKSYVCPSLVLLGEAIVEPEEIVNYFGKDNQPECEIMYNANLMVNIYNAFATRDTRLLTIDANLYSIPKKAAWMNYVRCHDDIGWGFNEKAIQSFGLNPYLHKQYLIQFFNHDFPQTFSYGEYYQKNEKNNDARTNGTLASLLGLDKSISENLKFEKVTSINRINLAHALILSYRGFPLIYSGDEIATLNDQSYLQDPNKKDDGRWVHRPIFDWERAKNKDIIGTVEYEVYQTLKHLISIRKECSYFHGNVPLKAIDLDLNAIFCFIRAIDHNHFIALFNFSENPQYVQTKHLRKHVLDSNYRCLYQNRKISLFDDCFMLSPYEFLWLVPMTHPL